MSIPVELPDLAEVMARYRYAYLLTANADGPPHAVAVVPVLEDGVLSIADLGQRTRRNLLAQPAVALVWPPQVESAYSLIVDGRAAMDGETLQVRPTRAVLHRPARRPTPAEPQGCAADCVELAVPAAAGGPDQR